MTEATVALKGVSDSFRNRADSAAFYEAWVGAVLARMGLYTLHYPFVVDGEDYHAQTWDLDVCAELPYPSRARVPIRVEVKSVELTFSSPDDYPFPDILVCSQASWMKKWPARDYTMRDFLFVSRKTGHIVWLPTMTQVELGIDVVDSGRGQLYKAVQAKSEHLRSLKEFANYVQT